jgi:hypothetical protein
MVAAAEFTVDGLGFVFACDEGIVPNAVDTADIDGFGKDGLDVSVCLEDGFSDEVFVGF